VQIATQEVRPRRANFADAFRPCDNSFGFLRLALALLVVFYHCFPLGGFGADPLQRITGGRQAFGSVAVSFFFVLSGFLVARSAVGASSARRFL